MWRCVACGGGVWRGVVCGVWWWCVTCGLYLQGKMSQADQLLQAALKINMETLGPHHPYTADCLTVQVGVWQ